MHTSTDDGITATQPPGGIELVVQDGVRVLRLRGEVDTSVVEAWQAGAPAGRPEAVDVSEATFLGAHGLRLLLRETDPERRAGRVPELRSPSRTVRRMVEIAGASDLFATVA